MIVVRDAGSVLVHPHDRRVDHLHRRIMTGDQRIHDLVPNASPPPTNEAIIAGRAGDHRSPADRAKERRSATPKDAV
jgi:hypothetical protein